MRPSYPDVLRAAISQTTSRRQLSIRLAETTGNKQESEYRALGKYLSGEETPSKDRAAILAVLLQAPQVALVPEAQDGRRRYRLEELADAVVEILENQREILALLKAEPQRQRREAAPTRTR